MIHIKFSMRIMKAEDKKTFPTSSLKHFFQFSWERIQQPSREADRILSAKAKCLCSQDLSTPEGGCGISLLEMSARPQIA